MSPDRFQEVKRIFSSALELEPSQRGRYLQDACKGEESLRREVEALLADHTEAKGFLKETAMEEAARAVAREQQEALERRLIGRNLAHYSIVENLGEGGMGVVYKAHDSHLDRSVALKVLLPEAMTDPDRKRRFIQEAKAASALNHPNIITVYDISTADGIDFIAMEYVAGKPLTQLIGDKALPLTEILNYAIQIADALGKAHRAGIIHRDLKPSNIMVTEDGLVKLLDFGLAKLTQQGQEKGTTSTEPPTQQGHVEGTSSTKSLTQSGAIVGTAAYMSPEQAEGKRVDARSDIFTFGAVLYEIVTGRRAFKGDSNISTLAAVVHNEPEPVAGVNSGVPKELEATIVRCLKKDPAERFQRMDDVRVVLTDLREESDSSGLGTAARLRMNPPAHAERETEAAPAKGPGWKVNRLLLTATALLVLLAGGTITWRVLYWDHPVPPLRVVPLTTYPGMESCPGFSPDGKELVFSWDGPGQDNSDLYVRVVSGGEPRRLTTHPGIDGWPAWSPDGRLIAFARWVVGSPDVEVLTVPALGGAERTLYKLPIPHPFINWPGLCWTPDGRWLVIPIESRGLGLISAETPEVRRLTEPSGGSGVDCCPAMAADGRKLAFLRFSSGPFWNLYILPLGPDYGPAGPPRQLTFESTGVENPMWTGNGREVLYTTRKAGGKMLFRIPYDGSRPASPIESLGPIGSDWAISPRGDRLVYSDDDDTLDIWRIDLPAGKDVNRVLSSSASDSNPQIAPDGKRVAFLSGRENVWQLWVSDPDGTHAIALTPVDIQVGSPCVMGSLGWSPDGKEIAFESRKEGNFDVSAVPSGGGAVRRLTHNPAQDSFPSWSHDGKWVYITSNRSGSDQVWKVPSDGTETGAVQLTKGGGYDPVESVEGGTVYFLRENRTIWKVAAGGGEETPVGGFRSPMSWTVSREGIYYASSDDPERWFDLWKYRFSTAKSERITRVNKLQWWGMSVSPDDRWLLFTANDVGVGDLYMIENFR